MLPVVFSMNRYLIFPLFLALGVSGCQKTEPDSIVERDGDSVARVASPGENPESSVRPGGITSQVAITGKVGVESGRWNVLRMRVDESIRSTATFSGPTGLLRNFTIQGHRGTSFAIQGSLALDFSLREGALVASGATYFPDAGMYPNYVSHDDSVRIQLEEVIEEGESVRVKGAATGVLYRVASMTASPDLEDSLPLEVSFQALVYPE